MTFTDRELQTIKHEVIRWGISKNKTVKETALAIHRAVDREMKKRQGQGKVRAGEGK